MYILRGEEKEEKKTAGSLIDELVGIIEEGEQMGEEGPLDEGGARADAQSEPEKTGADDSGLWENENEKDKIENENREAQEAEDRVATERAQKETKENSWKSDEHTQEKEIELADEEESLEKGNQGREVLREKKIDNEDIEAENEEGEETGYASPKESNTRNKGKGKGGKQKGS